MKETPHERVELEDGVKEEPTHVVVHHTANYYGYFTGAATAVKNIDGKYYKIAKGYNTGVEITKAEAYGPGISREELKGLL